MLKKLSLLFSITYTIVLSLISLINLNDLVEDVPSFNDKVAHVLAHFIFVLIWFVVFYYQFNYKYNKAIILVALFSLTYGVLIELLQSWITISRESDFKDVYANIIGMMFAVLILLGIKKRLLKKE